MEIFLNDTQLRVAQLLFERGSILESLNLFEVSGKTYIEKDPNTYLNCCKYMLRGLCQIQEFDKIKEMAKQLELRCQKKWRDNPRSLYLLAFCQFYLGSYYRALELAQKSLKKAVEQNDPKELCYATLGLSLIYYKLGDIDQSLKEVENLELFLKDTKWNELILESLLIHGHILRRRNKYSQSLQKLWEGYEKVKEEKNFYSHLNFLYALGLTYKEKGDLRQARTYLELVASSADKNNMKQLHKLTLNSLIQMDPKGGLNLFDLVYETQTRCLYEKTKGKIDLSRQLILLKILELFLESPGRIFSKKELIEKIWKEKYKSCFHDNKIHATIKRLRKIVEPDSNRPKYIFLSRKGYYLDTNVKIRRDSEASSYKGLLI